MNCEKNKNKAKKKLWRQCAVACEVTDQQPHISTRGTALSVSLFPLPYFTHSTPLHTQPKGPTLFLEALKPKLEISKTNFKNKK